MRRMLRVSVRAAQIVVAALIVSLFVAVQTPTASASEAGRLVTLINSSRAKAGLPPLAVDGTLNSIASAHAHRMAQQNRVYHNPSYPGGAGAWQSWGENVGYGSNADQVHNALMNSSIHRANILSRAFNALGVGTASSPKGLMVVEDFLQRPGGAPPPPNPKPRPVVRPAAPPPPPPPPPEPDKPLQLSSTYTAVVVERQPELI